MSESLDRKVAIEIMGEPEPKMLSDAALDHAWQDHFDEVWHYSEGGNWYIFFRRKGNGAYPEWRPKPFSTSLSDALRALDEYFSDADEVNLHIDRIKSSKGITYCAYASVTRKTYTRINGPVGLGDELAEAICHHVLALKEREGQ